MATATVCDHHGKVHAVEIPAGWVRVPTMFAKGWQARIGDMFLDINDLTFRQKRVWRVVDDVDLEALSNIYGCLIRREEHAMQPECDDLFSLFAHEVKHCGEARPYTEWLAEYEGDLHADWLMSQVRAADDEAARERQAIAAEMARVMPCYDTSDETPF